MYSHEMIAYTFHEAVLCEHDTFILTYYNGKLL